MNIHIWELKLANLTKVIYLQNKSMQNVFRSGLLKSAFSGYLESLSLCHTKHIL